MVFNASVYLADMLCCIQFRADTVIGSRDGRAIHKFRGRTCKSRRDPAKHYLLDGQRGRRCESSSIAAASDWQLATAVLYARLAKID